MSTCDTYFDLPLRHDVSTDLIVFKTFFHIDDVGAGTTTECHEVEQLGGPLPLCNHKA